MKVSVRGDTEAGACRAAEEAELRLRMEELEALEAAFEGLEGPPSPTVPPPPPDFRNWRTAAPDLDPATRPRLDSPLATDFVSRCTCFSEAVTCVQLM